jgi:hypothetical protein
MRLHTQQQSLVATSDRFGPIRNNRLVLTLLKEQTTVAAKDVEDLSFAACA